MERALCRDAAGGVVEVVEVCADVGGELSGGYVPVDYFGVGVAKGASRARCLGIVECGAVVGVEGGQTWRC